MCDPEARGEKLGSEGDDWVERQRSVPRGLGHARLGRTVLRTTVSDWLVALASNAAAEWPVTASKYTAGRRSYTSFSR